MTDPRMHVVCPRNSIVDRHFEDAVGLIACLALWVSDQAQSRSATSVPISRPLLCHT